MKKNNAIKQINDLHAALRNLFRRSYADMVPEGLTPLEGKFIGYIGDHQDEPGGVISRDLIEEFGLRKPTVSETLATLIKKGYILFIKDREDGRMKSIVLTEKGRDYYAAASPIMEGFDCSFNDVLTEEEQKQLENISNKLLSAIKERSKKK